MLAAVVTPANSGSCCEGEFKGRSGVVGLMDVSNRGSAEVRSDYYQPDDIARLLDHTWNVLINETRPRATPAPSGTHHTHDTVLRALRLP
jgi:hypothetical protein